MEVCSHRALADLHRAWDAGDAPVQHRAEPQAHLPSAAVDVSAVSVQAPAAARGQEGPLRGCPGKSIIRSVGQLMSRSAGPSLSRRWYQSPGLQVGAARDNLFSLLSSDCLSVSAVSGILRLDTASMLFISFFFSNHH